MSISNSPDDNGSRAEVRTDGLSGSGMFEEVTTAAILGQVSAKLNEDAARSLWLRIQTEFASGGAGEMSSYLQTQFSEIAQELRANLAAAEDDD